MDGDTLQNILKSDALIARVYAGLYSRDTLPPLQPNLLYLLNSDFSQGNGEHWFILSTLEHGKVHFMCSFATAPRTFPLIYQRIQDSGRTISCLSRRLQCSFLTNCSSFSLLFSYFLTRRIWPPQMMANLFRGDLYKINVLTCAVIRVLFRLPMSIEELLYDPLF